MFKDGTCGFEQWRLLFKEVRLLELLSIVALFCRLAAANPHPQGVSKDHCVFFKTSIINILSSYFLSLPSFFKCHLPLPSCAFDTMMKWWRHFQQLILLFIRRYAGKPTENNLLLFNMLRVKWWCKLQLLLLNKKSKSANYSSVTRFVMQECAKILILYIIVLAISKKVCKLPIWLTHHICTNFADYQFHSLLLSI